MAKNLTFVFGDIHGCLEELEALVSRANDYAKGQKHTKIFLGDYVDRGPDSRGVIEYLMNLPGNNVFLRGNHEQMFLDAIDALYVENWLRNGGEQTLASYPDSAIDRSHVNWMNSLKLCHQDDLRYYVHAGVRPSVPLRQQDAQDQLWIRKEFVTHDKQFEKYVVHGHTVESTMPVIKINRCNLDTGGVFGYNFTVGVFDDENESPIDIIQVPKVK